MNSYSVMALAARARVLNDDQVFSGRDECGFPELGAKVDADDLTGGESGEEEE
jgi:hypothetical protein